MVQASGQNNTTNYSSGGVYKNGTLSYMSTGQGRTDMTKSPPRQEYFVKDHLGNIRSSVASATTGGVSPGPQSLAYTAGYEPADAATETALFEQVSELSAAKPGSLSAADQKAALLQDNQRLGTSIMLKVMAGDKVDINAENFYESLQQGNSNNEAPAGQLFEQVIGSLAGGSGALSSAEGSNANVLAERILSNPEAVTAYEDLLAAETDSTRPKAFLNYLFFDEELNLVPEHSRIWQADGESSWSKIGSAEYVPLEVPQNGYIVAYLSNQSGQEAWFDNMSLVVSPGILLEERHYYAYGLPIAGLGSQAATATKNRQRYQGNEYIEELGLEWMDFHNRQYDPQLGRFLSVDPLAGAGGQQVLSPYHAMACNPVSMVDPLGLAYSPPGSWGGGSPTQMDIALMIPPTLLQESQYYNFNPSKVTDGIAERMIAGTLGLYLNRVFQYWGANYENVTFRNGTMKIYYSTVTPGEYGAFSWDGKNFSGKGAQGANVTGFSFALNINNLLNRNQGVQQSNGRIQRYVGVEGEVTTGLYFSNNTITVGGYNHVLFDFSVSNQGSQITNGMDFSKPKTKLVDIGGGVNNFTGVQYKLYQTGYDEGGPIYNRILSANIMGFGVEMQFDRDWNVGTTFIGRYFSANGGLIFGGSITSKDGYIFIPE
ncbi:MAG: RHS repeat-associated core domain-containing protein [Taibaiella sp.]|nr:RHS repeat-associated core domain-containing protein [Taibaiella sp.]